MEILLNKKELHIIYSCINEHWETKLFETNLSDNEFKILQKLREKIDELDSSASPKNQNDTINLELDPKEMKVLIKAVKIGLDMLDKIEFPIIVGQPYEAGLQVLQKLCRGK
jgi:hypothetical protein